MIKQTLDTKPCLPFGYQMNIWPAQAKFHSNRFGGYVLLKPRDNFLSLKILGNQIGMQRSSEIRTHSPNRKAETKYSENNSNFRSCYLKSASKYEQEKQRNIIKKLDPPTFVFYQAECNITPSPHQNNKVQTNKHINKPNQSSNEE